MRRALAILLLTACACQAQTQRLNQSFEVSGNLSAAHLTIGGVFSTNCGCYTGGVNITQWTDLTAILATNNPGITTNVQPQGSTSTFFITNGVVKAIR